MNMSYFDIGKETMEVLDDEVCVESNDVQLMDNAVNLEDDNNNLATDFTIVLEVGMQFKDEKELFDFYKSYAYEVGFPIRKRNSKKGDDGLVRYVTLTPTSGMTYQTAGFEMDCQLHGSSIRQFFNPINEHQ